MNVRSQPCLSHRLRVTGTVQGVGFRPMVYRLAQETGARGWVLNDPHGVLIHLEGADPEAFSSALEATCPPLGRIDTIAWSAAQPEACIGFTIKPSAAAGGNTTRISADAATCEACLSDVFNPEDRRAGYAFTNCTHCGPRYTITEKMPYDRHNTSMKAFDLCPACRREYEDPLDRRFHAQPNACPSCGPALSHTPETITACLMKGGVVALKGLGGYQLLADARQEAAVARLRRLKHRDGKPFAIMVPGRRAAARLAELSEPDWALMQDHRRPIVVMRQAKGAGLAESVTLGLQTIGLMLPTTALHALLFHAAMPDAPSGLHWMDETSGPCFVCTSANRAGEPLISEDETALQAFDGHVDLVVTHNRAITIPVDDSVTRVMNGTPVVLRRARGHAPEAVALSVDAPTVLALGADLKNTICISRGREAFLSQHIGSQTNLQTQDLQRRTIQHLLEALDVSPALVVTDLHPDMNTHSLKALDQVPVLRVQHHHAHIASVLAEHQIRVPTLGVALDGYGLGADARSSWGGEIMTVSPGGMQHHSGLIPLPAPGGDAAARSPWRMAVSLMRAAGLKPLPHLVAMPGFEMVDAMVTRHINAPETSSAGRLFDAVASLLDIQHVNRFEGEAAMRLEDHVTAPQVAQKGWRIEKDGRLNLLPLVATLAGLDANAGANLFHGTFAAALTAWVQHHHANITGLSRYVALSGGCFQNKCLGEGVASGLRAAGFRPLFNQSVPANDGGLALGQAWVATHHLANKGA